VGREKEAIILKKWNSQAWKWGSYFWNCLWNGPWKTVQRIPKKFAFYEFWWLKFPYFADITERAEYDFNRGEIQPKRQGEFRDNSNNRLKKKLWKFSWNKITEREREFRGRWGDLNKLMDGWMDGWMNKWMNVRMNENLLTSQNWIVSEETIPWDYPVCLFVRLTMSNKRVCMSCT
jgi:hypothetical protein